MNTDVYVHMYTEYCFLFIYRVPCRSLLHKGYTGSGCILIIVMFPFDQKYNNDVVRLNANRAWQEENRLCVVICMYTSIQMKCQGGVIFVHAPRLFYCPKRRIGYARSSLTGNKNYSAIPKLTNTM